MAEEKKKNPFQKLKEGIEDKEEQLAIISLFVRLGVVASNNNGSSFFIF